MDDIDQLIARVRRLHREQHVSAYGYRVLLDALGELKEEDKPLVDGDELEKNPCGRDR